MKKPEWSRGAVTTSWVDWMGRLLRGSGLAVMITLLGLFLGALCISNGILSQGQMEGIVLASCVVGALCGGVFAIGTQGLRAIPMGLGVAAILFFMWLIGGMIIYGNSNLSGGGIGVLCACLCGGTMAGIVCRKRKKKSRR